MPPSWPSPLTGLPTALTALPHPGLRKRPRECYAKPGSLKSSMPLGSGPLVTSAKVRNENLRCLFTTTCRNSHCLLPLFNHRASNLLVMWGLASTGPSRRQPPCHSALFHKYFHRLVAKEV